MIMIELENEELLVNLSAHGAELTRIFYKKANQEVLYDGKGNWDHGDHVLFPIIGDNRAFAIEGKAHFIQGTHGFARFSDFEVTSQTKDSVTLSLTHKSDDAYPFDCRISVTTRLDKNQIIRDSEISSLDGKQMAFQYGLHPAFICDFASSCLSLSPDTLLLELEKGIIKRRIPWAFGQEWKIERSFIEQRDTLVLTNPSGKILLRNGKGRTVSLFSSCPYFAIWTPEKPCKNDFICLESWYGVSPYDGIPLELGERDNAQKTKDVARYHDVLLID